LSFCAAGLASTHHFCYSAVASSSVVLILPVRYLYQPIAVSNPVLKQGFIVLCGSLELSSRNIISGAVRLCYALMYSLFLGFGLAIGAEVYEKISNKALVGPEDYSCKQSHDPSGPWWQRTPSLYFGEGFFTPYTMRVVLVTDGLFLVLAFLTVPMYSTFLSMRNQAPWNKKEMVCRCDKLLDIVVFNFSSACSCHYSLHWMGYESL
jgi:hypothetical protein